MAGQYVIPVRTHVEHEDLRLSLARAWRSLFSEEPPSDAIAMLLAQSALETGYWKECRNWNLGGIKAPRPEGRYTFFSTLEVMKRADAEAMRARSTPQEPCEFAYDDAGPKVTVRFRSAHPVARFRAYRTLDESATGFVSLLARRYSEAIAAAREGDASRFVHELHENDYFTGSEKGYRSSVEALFAMYREPCLATETEVSSALVSLGIDLTRGYEQAVRQFQMKARCFVDGRVGSQTRQAIRSALAARAAPPSSPAPA